MQKSNTNERKNVNMTKYVKKWKKLWMCKIKKYVLCKNENIYIAKII